MDSICKFVPVGRMSENIDTTNYVYETKIKRKPERRMSSVYAMHYVTEGEGTVLCGEIERKVRKGDIFFAFPAVSYAIYGGEDFRYMFVSFIGIRANAELERLGINSRNFVFEGYDDVEKLWREGIELKEGVTDLVSESVVLYTLARIGDRVLALKNEAQEYNSELACILIKKYIDENFADATLSLDTLSKGFLYNKKYISVLFKKHYKIGIAQYVNMVRINHACVLIERNYTGVSDIAFLCGFNDSLYFSKVFKKLMSCSPKEYINEVRKNKD